MSPLHNLRKLFELQLIHRASQAYRHRCKVNGDPHTEPADASRAWPVNPLTYEVVLISAEQVVLATYRISFRGLREVLRPVRQPAPRRPRADTVVRLPRSIVERVRATAAPGRTIHQTVEQLLTAALDGPQTVPLPAFSVDWREPLRRIGLLSQ